MIGPILYFRGATDEAWRLAVLAGPREGARAETLRLADGSEIAPRRLGERGLWRYEFSLPRNDGERQAYDFGGRPWPVHVPAPGAALRIAYTACSGVPFEDFEKVSPDQHDGWRHLTAEHARDPFHLLLHGGDQLYADTIWTEVPALKAWQRLPRQERLEQPFTPDLEKAVAAYYFARYAALWSQEELLETVASVPSLMMWDDHDIFDGWGSYDADAQAAPVYQGIWRAARDAFALFQLAALPDDLPDGFGDRRGGHFGWAYRLGEIGIVAPDLRSGRDVAEVMGPESWRWLEAALRDVASCRHVLLLMSVPLAHADLSPIERLLVPFRVMHNFQDDLRDQWASLGHKDDLARISRLLTEFSAESGARVTVLSGEIHLAALGVIEGAGVTVTQLTAPAIVSPPPGAAFVALLEQLAKRPQKLAPGLTIRMLPLPGTRRRYLRECGWIALDLAPGGPVDAFWHTEPKGAPRHLAIAALR